jgi:hypothetical protein
MTPEERQMLSGLFDRIRGASTGPKDREAESFIEDAMRNTPSAGYVLAQTVLVQQQAVEAAAKRIEQLEAQVKSGGEPQQEGSFLGNLGRSLFGGGAQPPQQPPRAGYDARAYERPPEPPPGYGQRPGYAPPPPQGGAWGGGAPQAGPWGAAAQPQGQGGGFLHGAVQTAAGVAGGVLLGNAIGGLFGGSHGGGMFGAGGFGGGGLGSGIAPVNETVNNYYESDPAGQHAEDVLQDQDQDQDDAQDAADDGGGGGGDDWT